MKLERSRDDVLRELPPETLSLLEAVIASAERCGGSVYLVGGPVRDLLLEREIRDVDLIVELPGCEASAAATIARKAAVRDARVVEHGRFGTVRLENRDGAIDLASMRRERYERPGKLPVVEPGCLEEDLQRRDFSINALAMPLTGSASSQGAAPIDLVNGLQDLAARRLKVLHRRSFHDDPTRALRAARLAGRLGFSLARGSRSLLRDAVRDGVFGAVSGDRLRREIEKCFSEAALGLDVVTTLRLLDDWYVLPALEPGLALPREAVAPLRRLSRALHSPPWRSGRLRPWVAGLSLWLAPLSPALRARALRRFSVRGDVAERIAGFAKNRDQRLRALASLRGRGAVDAALAGIDEEELHALHAFAEPAVRRRIVRWAAEDRARRSPVTGEDLLALGLSGPAVGRALSRVRSAYLDGEVANREEAIALAEELVRQKGTRRAARKRVRSGGARRTSRKGARASDKPG